VDVEHDSRFGRFHVCLARRDVCSPLAIERLRFPSAKAVGMAIFLAYLVPPSILFIPLATIRLSARILIPAWRLMLTIHVPHPVLAPGC